MAPLFSIALAAVALAGPLSGSPAAPRCSSPAAYQPRIATGPILFTSPAKTSLHKIYVADELAGTVSVVDAETNHRIGAIPLAYAHGEMAMVFAPHNIQASPDGRTVWVTAPPPMQWTGCGDGDSLPPPPMPPGMGEEVVVIDPVADTILARIMLLPQGKDTMLHVAHVVLDRDARFAYVSANFADEIIQIDARTFQETRRFELAPKSAPHGMRFCGDKLVIANMGKSLSVLDPAAGRIEEVPLGGIAVQVACTRDGQSAFATLYDTREVARYDLATGTVSRIPLGAEARGPVQLYLTPDDRRLFVADQGVLFNQPAHNLLYVIDVSSNAVTGTVRVGRAPHGVTISDDGAFAYVTNLWDATISAVDLTTLRETATVQVGDGPNGITYWKGAPGINSAMK